MIYGSAVATKNAFTETWTVSEKGCFHSFRSHKQETFHVKPKFFFCSENNCFVNEKNQKCSLSMFNLVEWVFLLGLHAWIHVIQKYRYEDKHKHAKPSWDSTWFGVLCDGLPLAVFLDWRLGVRYILVGSSWPVNDGLFKVMINFITVIKISWSLDAVDDSGCMSLLPPLLCNRSCQRTVSGYLWPWPPLASSHIGSW